MASRRSRHGAPRTAASHHDGQWECQTRSGAATSSTPGEAVGDSIGKMNIIHLHTQIVTNFDWHLESIVATAEAKSVTEHDNDRQVQHQHSEEEHCLAPKIATERKADSPEWRASNATALEKGVQTATPSQMLVGTADVKSMTENENDQPVLHEHSAEEDGTAPKIATAEDCFACLAFWVDEERNEISSCALAKKTCSGK